LCCQQPRRGFPTGAANFPLRIYQQAQLSRYDEHETHARPGGHHMRNVIANFVRNESGATAIEYGLIAAGIAVAIIVTVQALGTQLNTTFSSVSSALK
jgi:pilus assembly protein Flp/PilA